MPTSNRSLTTSSEDYRVVKLSAKVNLPLVLIMKLDMPLMVGFLSMQIHSSRWLFYLVPTGN